MAQLNEFTWKRIKRGSATCKHQSGVVTPSFISLARSQSVSSTIWETREWIFLCAQLKWDLGEHGTVSVFHQHKLAQKLSKRDSEESSKPACLRVKTVQEGDLNSLDRDLPPGMSSVKSVGTLTPESTVLFMACETWRCVKINCVTNYKILISLLESIILY